MNFLQVKKYYVLIIKFIYSPLGKAFEKQIKAISHQGTKQVEALKPVQQKLTIKDAIREDILNEEAKNIIRKN